jgi:hypothetical protein
MVLLVSYLCIKSIVIQSVYNDNLFIVVVYSPIPTQSVPSTTNVVSSKIKMIQQPELWYGLLYKAQRLVNRIYLMRFYGV